VRKKPEISLRARALQYLARREYSRAELRGKLLPYAQTNEDPSQPENLDALLDDLTARGWLSDARAATQLLRAKRREAEQILKAPLLYLEGLGVAKGEMFATQEPIAALTVGVWKYLKARALFATPEGVAAQGAAKL